MTQRAHFWTYRAGAAVLTSDGRSVGRISAVQRDRVLVTRADGQSSWIAAEDVIDYDGSTLTVTPSTSVGPDVENMNLAMESQPVMPSHSHLSANPKAFDA